ncbi:hypothetical protein C5167_014850 [Papaver somniferum]|uniref:Uncharacterized protein n=1 Tax=Papaver somniferum TaxID=3469 RepID=A0A4Y7J7G8_PAPSO|nr:hypothetical protein C5167_014850 [Papaver somniferum]
MVEHRDGFQPFRLEQNHGDDDYDSMEETTAHLKSNLNSIISQQDFSLNRLSKTLLDPFGYKKTEKLSKTDQLTQAYRTTFCWAGRSTKLNVFTLLGI